MKGWRPKEGWNNPEKGKPDLHYGRSIISTEKIFEAGADAILEKLEKKGIKGEVKACPIPAMVQDEITFDDFDTVFISEDEKLEVCLNGAEELVYGKQSCHIITPVEGYLTFIPKENETH